MPDRVGTTRTRPVASDPRSRRATPPPALSTERSRSSTAPQRGPGAASGYHSIESDAPPTPMINPRRRSLSSTSGSATAVEPPPRNAIGTSSPASALSAPFKSGNASSDARARAVPAERRRSRIEAVERRADERAQARVRATATS